MGKTMLSPFVRLLLSLAIVLGALLILANVIRFGFDVLPEDAWLHRFEGIFYAVPLNVVMVIAYWFYVKRFEYRNVDELGSRRAVQEFTYGALVGICLLSVIIGVLWALGYYQVSAFNHYTIVLLPFVTMLARSLGEELIFRVILFRIVEEGLGSWFALLISSVLFGLGHIGNPAATWLSTLAISLEAGVLLGAVYMVTRRIWMAWGLHFAWNFMQGPVFGIEVSGTTQTGLLVAEMVGPDLITGGSFGVEASLFAVIICLAAGIVLLIKAKRDGQFLSPFWKRAEKE